MEYSDPIFTQASARIYNPYVVIEERQHYVHLIVSRLRKALFIFAFNVMPFVIAGLLVPVIIFWDGGMPYDYLILLVVCTLFAAGMLLFKRAIHKVIISDKDIEITSTRCFRMNMRSVSLPKVDHIYLRVTYGKGGGALFTLRLKNGQKIEFVVIPIIFMERDKVGVLCERLKEITGLPIKANYFGSSMIKNDISVIGQGDLYN